MLILYAHNIESKPICQGKSSISEKEEHIGGKERSESPDREHNENIADVEHEFPLPAIKKDDPAHADEDSRSHLRRRELDAGDERHEEDKEQGGRIDDHE